MKKLGGDPDTSPKVGTPSTGSLSTMTDVGMRMKGRCEINCALLMASLRLGLVQRK